MHKPETTVITLDEIGRRAPAALAEGPHISVSKRYGFISTRRLIGSMTDLGWYPVSAMQSASRRIKSLIHATHTVTFQRPGESLHVGGVMPQIILFNNHMASKAWKLVSGFLRLVCSNGLMVSTGIAEHFARRRHIGDAEPDVMESLTIATGKLSRSLADISKWERTELTELQRGSFAFEALRIRNPEAVAGGHHELLKPRREQDVGTDLWRTFNVVQENLIKGGVPMFSRRNARAIKAIDSAATINQRLWALADSYASTSTAIRS